MTGKTNDIIRFLLEQDDEKIFEIKEYKAKRTLTQNAYFWVLVNAIAEKLNYSKEKVHFQMLRDYGRSEVVSIRSDIDISTFFKYYLDIGSGKINNVNFTHYRIFKGSSDMNTAEMAALLDGTVQEAQQLGIPTLTEIEIAGLKP